jgi:hypothetical protein
MARNTKTTNKIIEAARHLEDEDEALLDEVGEEYGEDEGQDFDPADVDVDTMLEAVNNLPERQRAQLDATRKRGQAPRREAAPVHAGRARQEKREPVRRDRQVEWRPSDSLSAPPPRPGMENRWIRIRLGEKDDPRNFQKKFREGWKPISLSAVPEDFNPPSAAYGKFGDVVAVSDLVLCERPLEIGLSRKRYFAKRLQRQLDSADRRHVDRVQRDGHRIAGGARAAKNATVGGG